MDSGLNNFILGCIFVAPFLFVAIYLFKKKKLKSYEPPRSMMDDPWYSGSTWQRMRKNDRELKKL